MKNILFIGGIITPELEIKLGEKNKSMQTAANQFQYNVVNGLIDNGFNVKVISSPFIGAFPNKNRKIRISKKDIENEPNPNIIYSPFLNIFGIRNLSRKKNLIKTFKDFINKQNEIFDHVIIYSAHTPFLYLAEYIKDNYPHVKVSLILLDLPEYMRLTKKSFIYNVLKKYDTKVFYKKVSIIDKYILLTKHMAKKLNLTDNQYIIVEGIIDNKKFVLDNKKYDILYLNKKIITYTGTLNFKYGIKTLIDAYNLIKNKDTYLLLCGTGDANEYINKISNKDPNIIFYGIRPHNEILEIQQNSSVLVNPRFSDDEYTLYSFPSKNLEYLSSGTPVISAKLQGIPDEYDEYLLYFKENSARALADKLNYVLGFTKQQKQEVKKKNQEFVFKNKNNVYVTKKIADFINE